CTGLFFGTVLVVTLPVQAQNVPQQWDLCRALDDHGRLRTGMTIDSSIGACTAIIQSGNESSDNTAMALIDRGNAYNEKGQYDLAIPDCDKAVVLNQKFAAAFIGRGNSYIGKQEYDRAIHDFGQAMALTSNDPLAFNDRGNAFTLEGKYNSAIQDFDQAIL